ncbi:UNC-like C-terminal-domain-containing protein [Coniochaeta sp. 2T2.1]|nr:UNC-like C-terminal-domain-containing protein [Coniochaeta sp. 2T2.1]
MTVEGSDSTTPSAAGTVADDKDSTRAVVDQNEEEKPVEKSPEQQAAGDKEAEEQEDLATSSFMSFEEWKEMMLRKSGQDPAQIKGHEKPQKEHKGHREAGDSQGGLDGLGDDGEINIDFDALSEKVSEITAGNSAGSTPQPDAEAREEKQVLLDDGKMQYYRSKDAGKTCKERFSYSSFDAGGLVLKTSPGAKNAKSILVENKDSYMLLECHAKNKFVIVELSDDILVDTVVLANFEFFSSMIRKFRVSVSDRYPVKLDKWIELGTFEARNSRDIQAFLIEHPQIYTKYIRIEFLTHYGNEYYCPVSLLRVHGTRMLDSWKEPDNSRDDEEPETIEGTPEEQAPETSQQEAEPVSESPQQSNTTEERSVQQPEGILLVSQANLTYWQSSMALELFMETCNRMPVRATASPTPVTTGPVPAEGTSSTSGSASTSASSGQTSTGVPSSASSATSNVSTSTEAVPTISSSSSSRWPNSSPPPVPSTDSTPSSKTQPSSPSVSAQQQPSTKVNVTESASPPPQPKVVSSPAAPSKNRSATSTAPTKNKSTTSSASSASPTVQEGFFKAVTKRLQHLETNTSLSLQYIEEQSRFLQDALQKMEKRQVSRVDAFLDSLNKTVFAELRNVRAQYDQIWQSTVIALESQREQSQRETVALSERLSLLADEVVFQKRMAILQSVLLLAALVLVIFSRGYYVNAPAADYYSVTSPFRTHNHNASISAPALVDTPTRSPQSNELDLDSPEYSGVSPSPARTGSMRRSLSRSGSYQDKDLPLTPVSKSAASSIYSREATPAINVEEVDVPFFHDVAGGGNYATPPRKQRDGSLFSDDSEAPESVEGTPLRYSEESTRNEHDGYTSGSDILDRMQEQNDQQPQAKNPRWSAVSQLGGARKPLPALPEDVPEDQDAS